MSDFRAVDDTDYILRNVDGLENVLEQNWPGAMDEYRTSVV